MKIVAAAEHSLPLPHPDCAPPLMHIKYVSDAAGATCDWSTGECHNLTVLGDRRAASVRLDRSEVGFCKILKWSNYLMFNATNETRRPYGSKSAASRTSPG